MGADRTSPVESATLTATGTLVSGRVQVKGLYVEPTGIAGSVELRDGGSGGTLKIDISTPASVGGTVYMNIPQSGVLFATDVHATLTDAASVTIFYTDLS